MKTNNNIKSVKALLIIMCGLTLFLNTGCDDFLEENEVPRITGDFYTTIQGVDAAVDATYANMRFGVGGEFTNLLTELGTDLITGADGGVSKPTDSYNATLGPTVFNFYSLWENHYKAINITNEVLQSLPNITMTDAQRKSYTAEMCFFRAYFYFDLVQQFGNIPLVTIAEYKVRTDFQRAPVADVYNQIISDLRFAEENLRETASGSEQGKATRYAAAHLLAKVYLTRGSAVSDQRGQKPTDMDSTLFYAKKVIDSKKYSLLNNFSDLWNIENMGNKEVVFSVQFTNDLIYNGSGNLSHLYWCSPYESVPGIIRDIANGRPYAFHRATNKTMFQLFDRKNDSRFYKSFKWVNYCNKAVAGVMAVGDTAIYYSLNPKKPGRIMSIPIFNGTKTM